MCPVDADAEQADLDEDGAGDACDVDADDDGQRDVDEIACGGDPLDAAVRGLDRDGDGHCDAIDNCPDDANPDQADGDLQRFACEPDGCGAQTGCTYFERDGHQYLHRTNGNVRRSWSDARDFCAQMGGQLATIDGADEIDLFFQHAIGGWIGLEDLDEDGEFGWLDGTPLEFTDWRAGQPNGELCVEVLENMQWDDVDCEAVKAFTCEANLDGDAFGDDRDDNIDGDNLDNDNEVLCGTDPRDAADQGPDEDADGRCDLADNCVGVFNPDQAESDPDGFACGDEAICEATTGCNWMATDRSLYLACTDAETQLRWDESERFCVRQGGHLITIDDDAENDFARGVGNGLWIGMNDREVEGGWVWVSDRGRRLDQQRRAAP